MKARTERQIEKLADDIKDEIDSLNDIVDPRRRVEAARELIAYIEYTIIDLAEAPKT